MLPCTGSLEPNTGARFTFYPVHVVRKGQHPNFLGRSWLNRLPALLSHINGVHENSVLAQVLRRQPAALLQRTEGPASSVNPTPIHRPVPNAVTPKVEKELNRLQKAGIIE